MQAKSSAFLVLAVAIVVAALVMAFSPMLYTDHFINNRLTQPVPSGCTIVTTPAGGGGFIVVAHCPFWVQFN